MALSDEARTKMYVLLIILGCVGAAILLGVLFFEIPWTSQTKEELALAHKIKREKMEVVNAWLSKTMTLKEKVELMLRRYPVIDGHNDLPWNLRKLAQNDLSKVDFSRDLRLQEPWASYNESFTDIPRLRKGHVGAQFWVAYTDCESQGRDSVPQTLEQIDLIHRLIQMYSKDFQFCDSSKCIIDTVTNTSKIASLIGIEGGHSIQSSPGVLRQMYKLGVRYLTLTHSCNTPWADASPVDAPEKTLAPESNGLSDFGLELIDEMNRLGMMVDLSHVSESTMWAALARSKAPVIFSHSGAKAICPHHRNVGDDVLRELQVNGGIIMINFYSKFIQCDPSKNATLQDVILHMDHIRSVIGPDHIGIGGDYDGVDSLPGGLEDVSKYPNLFEGLAERGWSLNELMKVSGENILRVMGSVEKVSEQLRRDPEHQSPMQTILSRKALMISNEDADERQTGSGCITSKSLEKLVIKMKENNGTMRKEGKDSSEVMEMSLGSTLPKI